MVEFFHEAFGTQPDMPFALLVMWCLWMAWISGEIIYNLYHRSKGHRKVIADSIFYDHGMSIGQYGEASNQGGVPWWLYGGAAPATLAIFIINWQVVVFFLLLTAFGTWVSYENRVIANILHKVNWNKFRDEHDRKAAPKQAQAEPKWGNADSDDDFFSYDAGAASGGSSGGSAYGSDKRHSDDAALWAKAEDPNATESERMEAFKRVLKNKAKREGRTGRNVAAQ